LVIALFLVFSIFGWCGHSGPSDAKVNDVYLKMSAAAAFAAQRTKAGRGFAFYVKRRAKRLLEKNPSWGDESDYHSVHSRIGAEIDKVAAYVSGKLGTTDAPGPLGGASEPAAVQGPNHLDLADMAKLQTTSGPSDVSTRKATYVRDRRRRVAHIAWRATALHPDLWLGDESSLTPDPNRPALDEIVDRRLRMVERLSCNDSPVFEQRVWSIGGRGGPWNDTFRTALFEYPWIHFDPTSPEDPFTKGLTAAGMTPEDLRPEFTPEGGEIRFHLAVRLRPDAASLWRLDGYKINLDAGTTKASHAFDALVPNDQPVLPAFGDFWERNWMFCDHMLATLHVEAMRFGRRRRTGDDVEFDGASGATGIHLVPLIPDLGPPSAATLMDQGAKYFEGVEVSPNDLQVGDHISYWNNAFVREIMGSDFGLENSLVMDIVDEGVDTAFAGHGMAELGKDAFSEEMASYLRSQYEQLRQGIVEATQANPNRLYINTRVHQRSFGLARWEPYGEAATAADAHQMQAPGAWWIRVKLTSTSTASGQPFTMAQALGAFPSSVNVDLAHHRAPALPAGDFDADYQESIYIPLSVPKGVTGRWQEYFKRRNGGEDFFDPLDLEDIPVDKLLIPGFYHFGQQSKIPVFRPKVIP
jgi:hypothetical protein